jgi:hypothetical protein
MRRLVEGHPGHDTMFYNVMRAAMAQGQYVEDVFGSQAGYYKHALVNATRFFDGVFAVGDYVLQEMRFLGPDLVHVDSQIAYNGVPHWKLSVEEKMSSRQKLQAYANTLLGYVPDYVFTHVTRLVPSKGMWRDMRVLEHLETILRKRNESAILFSLSTEVPGRRPDDVRAWSSTITGRSCIAKAPRSFQRRSRLLQSVRNSTPARNIKSSSSISLAGNSALRPAHALNMEFMDIPRLRIIQPIHFEPFGIAEWSHQLRRHLRVLHICGCGTATWKKSPVASSPNVIVADYADLRTDMR